MTTQSTPPDAEPLEIWSVGAGAIGGTVAARLARAGTPVTVVDADAAHVEALRDPGLVVEGAGFDEPIRLPAYTPDEVDALAGPCDLLLLAVRSERTGEALAPFVDRLRGDVVSLQNGLNEETIADLVGAERTIGCVVGFGATWHEPGRVSLTSDGGLVIGRLAGENDARVERARDVLDAAFDTTVSGNVDGARWSKMIINAVTVLGAVGGVLTGEVVAARHRPLVCAVLAEAADTAIASGADLDEVLGVDPGLVARREDGWVERISEALDFVAEHFGQVKSTTLRDFEVGRPTEVAAVTGAIVARAGDHDVPTPVNARVLELLRAIEAGDRRPDPDNLAELSALVGDR